MCAAGRHSEVLAELAALLAEFPSLRAAIIGRWVEYVMRLCATDAFALEGYALFRASHFPEHLESAGAAASVEVARGCWHKVLSDFSDQHIQVVEACNLLGQFELVAERYTSAPWLRGSSHVSNGNRGA